MTSTVSRPVSRLVAQLAPLLDDAPALPDPGWIERLGERFSISDAITLDGILRGRAPEPSPDAGCARTLESDVLASRRQWIEDILISFRPGDRNPRVRFPAPRPGVSLGDEAAYRPYQQFYRFHQQILASRVQALRTSVREALMDRSAPLARLARLDAAFEEGLSRQLQGQFAVIPNRLYPRFKALAPGDAGDSSPEGPDDPPWLVTFAGEMLQVLLAELDTRLEPVLGLVEASNKEDSSSS